jgi:hypothetical protein
LASSAAAEARGGEARGGGDAEDARRGRGVKRGRASGRRRERGARREGGAAEGRGRHRAVPVWRPPRRTRGEGQLAKGEETTAPPPARPGARAVSVSVARRKPCAAVSDATFPSASPRRAAATVARSSALRARLRRRRRRRAPRARLQRESNPPPRPPRRRDRRVSRLSFRPPSSFLGAAPPFLFPPRASVVDLRRRHG